MSCIDFVEGKKKTREPNGVPWKFVLLFLRKTCTHYATVVDEGGHVIQSVERGGKAISMLNGEPFGRKRNRPVTPL